MCIILLCSLSYYTRKISRHNFNKMCLVNKFSAGIRERKRDTGSLVIWFTRIIQCHKQRFINYNGWIHIIKPNQLYSSVLMHLNPLESYDKILLHGKLYLSCYSSVWYQFNWRYLTWQKMKMKCWEKPMFYNVF